MNGKKYEGVENNYILFSSGRTIDDAAEQKKKKPYTYTK